MNLKDERLTLNQISFLITIEKHGGKFAHIPGGTIAIARDASLVGTHQTAASLVRRTLLTKYVIRQKMCYRLTPRGQALLNEVRHLVEVPK